MQRSNSPSEKDFRDNFQFTGAIPFTASSPGCSSKLSFDDGLPTRRVSPPLDDLVARRRQQVVPPAFGPLPGRQQRQHGDVERGRVGRAARLGQHDLADEQLRVTLFHCWRKVLQDARRLLIRPVMDDVVQEVCATPWHHICQLWGLAQRILDLTVTRLDLWYENGKVMGFDGPLTGCGVKKS